MSAQKKKKTTTRGRPGVCSIAAVVGLAAFGIVAGLFLEESLRERGASGLTALGDKPATTSSDGEAGQNDRPALRDPDSALRKKKVEAKESSGVAKPWEAPAAGSKPVPSGHKTAAEVGSPPPAYPDKPVAPAPPVDPQRLTPPKHNPGGVNGKRPPRPIQ